LYPKKDPTDEIFNLIIFSGSENDKLDKVIANIISKRIFFILNHHLWTRFY